MEECDAGYLDLGKAFDNNDSISEKQLTVNSLAFVWGVNPLIVKTTS